MTIEQTKAAIAVMQAYVDGKEIEFRMLDSSEKWRVTAFPIWDWGNYEYRVKLTPIEGWMNVYPGSVFKTFKEARDRAPLSDEVKTIKVREVEE